jgi:hypothetical protein
LGDKDDKVIVGFDVGHSEEGKTPDQSADATRDEAWKIHDKLCHKVCHSPCAPQDCIEWGLRFQTFHAATQVLYRKLILFVQVANISAREYSGEA